MYIDCGSDYNQDRNTTQDLSTKCYHIEYNIRFKEMNYTSNAFLKNVPGVFFMIHLSLAISKKDIDMRSFVTCSGHRVICL